MKCKKCGKSFKDIKAIGAHYRKSHPGAMKAKKPRTSKKDAAYRTGQTDRVYRFFKDMTESEREVMANLTHAYR